MKKFEYHVVNIEIVLGVWNIEKSLNNLGAEGWELISFFITKSGNYYNAVFKREINVT